MVDELQFETSKLNIQNGDTLVIRSNDVTIEQLGRLHERLAKIGLSNVNIIRLNFEDELQALSESQMNAAGWFRK